MSEWLLGIVGIIALGLLLEIVLPDGQITKYVRGAFSLLVIVAVIAPLPKIFGGDFEFVFDGVSYEIDSTYLTSQGEEYEGTLEGLANKRTKEEIFCRYIRILREPADSDHKRLDRAKAILQSTYNSL